jgi:hypothetical protein
MKRITTCVAVVMVLSLIAGCAGTPAARGRMYQGAGSSDSLLQALNDAKMDAVRKAVVDMVGPEMEAAQSDTLQEVLYGTNNPNALVYTDTMEVLRKDKSGDTYLYEISIAVNTDAVERTLRANGVIGQKAAPEPAQAESPSTASAAAESSAKAAASDASSVQTTGDDFASVSPEEERTIRRYVDTMTYMVTFAEESGVDPFLQKSAVGMANEFLASNGYTVIDSAQIDRLKEDQQLVYEEETGREVSIIQWIAQRLNADVYIEIDAQTTGETSGSRHYGKANITLKIFEASTGTLLGSVPYNSDRAFSTSSEQDAINNALQSSVYKAMPIATTQAQGLMAKALTRGIRYDLIVQNTPDSKLMSEFRRKLSRRVRDVRTISQSPEETVYHVYIIGRVEDLEDAVYEVAETVAGLGDMRQVLLRGKSITFNTGL